MYIYISLYTLYHIALLIHLMYTERGMVNRTADSQVWDNVDGI